MRGAVLSLALLTVGCSSRATHPDPVSATRTTEPAAAVTEPALDAAALEAAGGVGYFAGGCFWGVEHYLEQIDGVVRVESGYMGGHVEDPSYADVSSEESGHLETVRVYFDPAKVGYEEVAKTFFEIHDPTQADGQGPDIGPEYRSAVFVTGDEQRGIVEGLIERLEGRGYAVVTEIRPLSKFWLAEDYHQNHYVKQKSQPYCHAMVDRFGDG